MRQKTTVIYNGSCPICAREINVYRARAETAGAPLEFVDLSREDPSVFGLTRDCAARRLYARQGDDLVSGIDAFERVWRELPGFRWLARLSRVPGVGSLLRLLYDKLASPFLYALHRRREARKELTS